VSHRPLVFVTGLTVGDYLLWNWSLNGNHTVLALASGLTLPPLAVACLWLLTMSVARLIARSARRPRGRVARNPGSTRTRSRRPAAARRPLEEPPVSTAPAGSPPRKLAA
jgi:hypothetical protein